MHPLASFNICKTSRFEFAKVSVNSVFDISSEIKKREINLNWNYLEKTSKSIYTELIQNFTSELRSKQRFAQSLSKEQYFA